MKKNSDQNIEEIIKKNITQKGYSPKNIKIMMDLAPKDLGNHIRKIKELFDSMNLLEVQKRCHSLKGALGTLGLNNYFKFTEKMFLCVKFLNDENSFNLIFKSNEIIFKEKGSNRAFYIKEAVKDNSQKSKIKEYVKSYYLENYDKLNSKEMKIFLSKK